METHPLHQLLEKETCSALLDNFAQVFSNSPQICLADVEGKVVGQHPVEAQEISAEHLLPAIDQVRRLGQLSTIPSGVAAPVQARGKLVGALIVATSHTLTSSETAALQLFVHFLDTLVESSQIQRVLLQETRDRYRDLNLLYKAGETIAASLDLATVSRLLLNESIRLTQADEGAVMLLEQGGGDQLTVWASRGLDAVQDIGAGIPLGHELAEQSVQSGQTQIIEQPELGRRTRPLHTLLCLPLRTKDEILGVISLAYTRHERNFGPNTVKLLNALAQQAAVAIDNAQMFSDLIKLHTELEAANRRLMELDQLKSSFLGVVTHELRTPFANIDFSLQLIERYGTETWVSEQQEQWMQLIRLIREAKMMIDNLVSFAGLLKRGDLYWTEVDFHTLVREVAETLMATALSRQLDLQVESSEVMAPIIADKMRLAEAIYHLIHNAIKFNRPGGKVRVHYGRGDHKVFFEVQDTGVGIAPEKLESLWKSFSQVADPLKRGVEGLGLGLAMVKYVVNAHGGEVTISSEQDVGSTFGFWLPVARF
jgi:signal transduction histidine kinase